jgi:hypothetical protein
MHTASLPTTPTPRTRKCAASLWRATDSSRVARNIASAVPSFIQCVASIVVIGEAMTEVERSAEEASFARRTSRAIR